MTPRRFLICLALLGSALRTLAQEVPVFQWAKHAARGAGYEYSHGVVADASGNVITVGEFTLSADFDPGAGTFTLTPNSRDAYVSKFDPSGNLIWAKSYGGSGLDAGEAVVVDPTGNIYIGGFFQGPVDFDPGPGTFIIPSGSSYIMKLDPNGDFVWAQSTGSGFTDIAFHTTAVFQSSGAAVRKYDLDGNLIWTRSTLGTSISVDPSGDLLITGNFFGTVDFDPGTGSFPLTSQGSSDIFVSKLDANGNFVWAKRIGASSTDYGTAIVTDPSGNSYTTGYFASTVDFDPGTGTFNIAAVGNTDIFILKLDPSGALMWAKGFGSTQGDEGNAIAFDGSGVVYATGYFRGTTDFDPGAGITTLTTAGNQDIFINKLDANGNFVWATRNGSGSTDIGSAIRTDPSGNVLLTSYFYSTLDLDPTCTTANLSSAGNTDTFVQKLSVGFVPVVASFVPPSGPAGTPVFITGSNFSPILTANTVRFNGVLTGVSDATPTGITTVVPAGATTGPISVRIGCYTGTSATDFVVMSPPTTITNFSPQTGPIGTTVTITGTNFSTSPSSNFVYFGATRANVIFSTTTLIIAVVPPGATYKPITVTKGGSTAFSSKPFLVTFPGGGTIDVCSFSSVVNYAAGGFGWGIALGDLDSDGKTDVATSDYNGGKIQIFRNTSTIGTIDATSFGSSVDLGVGTNPYGVAIADIDGDGKLDIVAASYASNIISVFRNISTVGSITAGSFAARVDFVTGSNPFNLACQDLDGDGKTDIAVGNLGGGSISIWRNISTPGSFSAASLAPPIAIAGPSSGLAIADLDVDGKPDLVAGYNLGSAVGVARNISTPGTLTTGSFAPYVNFTVGAWPEHLVVGDLDADNRPDIVTSSWPGNTISILKNTSTPGAIAAGSFAPTVDLAGNGEPRGVAITDFDGDNVPDIGITNQTGAVSIYKNANTPGTITSGTFLPRVNYSGVGNSRGLVGGDIDGDGKPDLVVSNWGGSLLVMRNTVFGVPVISGLSATSGLVGSSVLIFGTNFSPLEAENTVYFGATKAVVTDATATMLNVIVPDGATYSPVSVLVGCSIGYSRESFMASFSGSPAIVAATFDAKVDFTTGVGTRPTDVELADIDGDGKPDAVTINDQSGTTSIFRNTSTIGGISFAPRIDLAAGASPQNIEVGDMNGDGKLDLITVSDGGAQVSIFRNMSSPGTINISPRVPFATGGSPVSVAVGDIDGDGRTDIAVANSGSGSISILRNTGTPTTISFAAKVDFAVGTTPYSIAIGDIDGDGKVDVTATNQISNTVSIFRNTSIPGSISLDARVDLSTGAGSLPFGVALGDMDVDGKLDVVTSNATNRTVSVFRFNGSAGSITTGTFDARVDFTNSAALSTTYVSIGDLNADGKPEMIVGNNTGATQIQVHRNTSTSGSITASSFATRVDFTTASRPYNVISGDLDGDEKPEIISASAASNAISVLRYAGVSCIPSVERNALVTLYNATDGTNWTDNSGWLTDPDEDNWVGVTVSGCHVVDLDLSSNNLIGFMPSEIGNLTALTNLNLFNNQISGGIPYEIGNLTALTTLTLSTNQLNGPLPPEIGNLVNLQSLRLGSNQLNGEVPYEIWNLSSLTSLHLYSNFLEGILPPEIGNLTNLTSLRLGGNYFYGGIPPEIGNLSLLTTLQLEYNYFDGEIPFELGNLVLLRQLLLNNNQLSGSVPIELGNLGVCDDLALQNNLLTDLPDLSATPIYVLNQNFADINVSENHLTFEDLEPNKVFPLITLGPQAKIPPGGIVGFVLPGPLLIPFTTQGTANFYQWYKDGLPIPGQTLESLNLASTTGGDVGFYYVRISSSIVTGVTLESEPFTVYTDVCTPVTRTAGDLDTSFDPLAGFSSTFNNPAVQSDGKIVVHTDYSIVNSIIVSGLIRFNSNGSQDGTFQSNLHGPTFVIQSNDKIITATGNGGLIRLETDGTDDPTFANPNYYNAYISALALQADGKVIVAYNEDGSPHVRRLNTNGTNDPSFVAPDVPDVVVVRVQSDGYILLGGQFTGGIMRLDPTGAIDPGFSAVAGDFVTDIAIQADGKIIVVGFFNYFNDLPHSKLVRLNADGSIDDSFDAVGVTDNIEFYGYPSKIAIQPDEKIILAGLFQTINGTSRSNLIRLNTNGTVDCFLDPEESTESASDVESERITGLVLQADGKILISGVFESYDGTPRFGLARVNGGTTGSCLPVSERNALIALYNSTAGASWTNKTNWLSADEDSWFGVTVTSCQVTRIDLPNNNLTGPLPPQIGDLPGLVELNLQNNHLNGSIPTQVGLLTSLDRLSLYQNQLSGSIPTQLGNLGSLRFLHLQQNQLTGPIPTQLGNLSGLLQLNLSTNLLTGSIPSSLGSLNSLVELGLSTNQLTGSIPTTLGNLGSLEELGLFENQLTGSIPPQLGNITTLKYLNLYFNQLSGPIPVELGDLSNLEVLDIFVNQLTGPLPKELAQCTNLRDLEVADNQLSGTLPLELGSIPNLRVFQVGINNFTGTVPIEYQAWTAVEEIYLNDNQFTDIPAFTASTLTTLSVENNLLEFDDLEPSIGVANYTYAPQADLPGGTLNVNAGSPLTIVFSTGGSANQYQWFKNGVLVPGATSATFLIAATTLADAGSYTVDITNTLATALTLHSLPFVVSITPVINITLNTFDEIVCDGDIGTFVVAATGTTNITYQWQYSPDSIVPFIDLTNTGGYSGTMTPTLSINTAGTFGAGRYRCRINGDLAVEVLSYDEGLFINPPPAAPGTSGGSGCAFTSISLTATGGATGQYRWYTVSTGGSPIVSQFNSIYLTPALSTTTTYYAAINNGTCESMRTPVIATVLALPSSPTVLGSQGCAPSASLTLSASGGSPGEYRWYTVAVGGSPIAGETNGSYLTPALTATATFFVSINNGVCESLRVPADAQIRDCTPTISAATAQTPVGSSVSINIALLVTIISDPIDISSIKVITQPSSGAIATIVAGVLEVNYDGVSFVGTDLLTIEACDQAGHCAQKEITIEVVGDITVFNAISPNGDGKNDTFVIQYIEALPETQKNKVTIFNRWGTVVFEVADYNNSTNVFKGLSNSGDELPSGTYYYTIEFSSGAEKRTGFVSLRR